MSARPDSSQRKSSDEQKQTSAGVLVARIALRRWSHVYAVRIISPSNTTETARRDIARCRRRGARRSQSPRDTAARGQEVADLGEGLRHGLVPHAAHKLLRGCARFAVLALSNATRARSRRAPRSRKPGGREAAGGAAARGPRKRRAAACARAAPTARARRPGRRPRRRTRPPTRRPIRAARSRSTCRRRPRARRRRAAARA